jgi:hypothetical protein
VQVPIAGSHYVGIPANERKDEPSRLCDFDVLPLRLSTIYGDLRLAHDDLPSKVLVAVLPKEPANDGHIADQGLGAKQKRGEGDEQLKEEKKEDHGINLGRSDWD